MVRDGLKTQQKAMEALQQRVMQIARNTPTRVSSVMLNCRAKCRTRSQYASDSSAIRAAKQIPRNQFVCQYAAAMEKSSESPCSFHTPLLLLAMTRKR